jgi:type IV secretory pathway VirJ component
MTRHALVCTMLLALVALPARARAAAGQAAEVVVRGKTLTVTVYVARGSAPPKGSVVMGSGDVGWVGLAVTLAEFLSDEGYNVAGINVRQYLSSFTSGKDHVTVAQIAQDYATVAEFLRGRQLLARPVVLSGVSEGAALAVAAAAGAANHEWVQGVLTLGLPPSAELAWRWSDFTAWITKKDASEPSFEPDAVIAGVAPLPIWMIQSTRDEYVKETDYRRFEAAAKPPKRLVLIEAGNHRFTDKIPELKEQVIAGLAWIAAGAPASR